VKRLIGREFYDKSV